MFWGRSSRIFNKCYFIKVEKKLEILENFKTAISSTVKSLSNSENIEVTFGGKNLKSEKDLIRLPELEEANNKINNLSKALENISNREKKALDENE